MVSDAVKTDTLLVLAMLHHTYTVGGGLGRRNLATNTAIWGNCPKTVLLSSFFLRLSSFFLLSTLSSNFARKRTKHSRSLRIGRGCGNTPMPNHRIHAPDFFFHRERSFVGSGNIDFDQWAAH